MGGILEDKKIFIVEDNVHNRVIFQMALTKHGASVEFERWGKDTVPRLNALRRVDLIVLDLMLAHGVSGFDLFNEIRKLPNFAQTPIVAISASEPAAAMTKAMQQGFSGFIAKPIDDLLLPQQLARLIEGEKIWHAGGIGV